MKRLLTLALVMTITLSSAQIRKIETTSSKLIGKIGRNIELTKSGNVYTISYNDINFRIDEFKSFSFKDIDNDFENLYKMIIEGFENPPNDDIKIELPNDVIWLKYKKSLGKVNLQINHAVNKDEEIIGTTIFLTKKKVIKLFGKKKRK